jgi:biotin carboxyl carrier protein
MLENLKNNLEKKLTNLQINNFNFNFNLSCQLGEITLDIVPDGEGGFHVLKNGKSHRAELLEADFLAKTYRIRVDGDEFSIHIADQYERLIEQMGLKIGSAVKQNSIKAPMPGLVLTIAVEVGQSVKKGDPLVILEAMKMENVLKSAADATVKKVCVQKGQAVEKGALLLEMA